MYKFILLVMFIIFPSCDNSSKETKQSKVKDGITESEHGLVNKRLDAFKLTKVEIDSLLSNNHLLKLSYPGMSRSGGSLDGFYYNNELVFINSMYRAELGFTETKYYLSGSNFSEIIYHQHFPETEKYLKKYPLDKFEYDESKFTYSDTKYQVKLIGDSLFQKQSNGKLISSITDTVLLKRLIRSGNEMKLDLESIE